MRTVDRRAFLMLSCALASLARAAVAAPDDEPPILRTGHSQFTLLRPLRTVPALPIPRADGAAADFAALRGKVLVVNFWATWCPPCVAEMPALDRLQRDLGGATFAAVAIALDREGPAAVGPFFRAHGIRHLAPYFDGSERIAHADADNVTGAPFAVYGLPISYVVDHQGAMRGYITGAVDWDSGAARALCRHYIQRA